MKQYTNGEWRAEITDSTLIIFSDGGTSEFPYYATIATINNWDERECKANARLIKEAPHMHEVLEDFLNWFIDKGYDRELPLFRKAQVALRNIDKYRIKRKTTK